MWGWCSRQRWRCSYSPTAYVRLSVDIQLLSLLLSAHFSSHHPSPHSFCSPSSHSCTHTHVCRMEELGLLSKLEDLKLLSKLEASGLTLSKIEESGLLSKAEKAGILSLIADK